MLPRPVTTTTLSASVSFPVYVPTDRQTANIFTKPLVLDKLPHFFSMLGPQHLDMSNLRRRSASGKEEKEVDDVQKAKLNDEFDQHN